MIYSLGDKKLQIVGEDYFIAENATVIGSVIIHNDVSIWFNAVIRGDNDPITIGEGTNIQDGAVIHTDEGIPLNIGKGITVGHQAMLHGCAIGDNSLVGINAVILNHAEIGKNCIIGANCLITQGKEIPDNSMVLGSPGKVIREVTQEEIVELKHSAEHYVANFKRFKKELQIQD
ncbi:MAG: gamma carbonic anhydrase family protein [Thermodesulfobacteriota bacterium]|nr:MAG: gamma carbonic anhydrase family protein [Thermodesulfobacteriota bacterium]